MKDTNNKLDYNVWSAGEYNNNYNGFAGGSEALIQVNNSFSNIGESSLKITRKHELYGTSCFTRLSNLTGTNNINATLIIYSPNNDVGINLFNGSVLTSINCPASSTLSHVSLNCLVNSNYVDLRIFLNNPNDYVFIDNINISY